MRIVKAIEHSSKVDLSDIDVKLGKIKDLGNQLYTKKMYKEAISKFSEGIDLYLKDQESFKKDKDVKLKTTQLYTNRSLSYHQLDNQQNAFDDADHVLRHLEPGNVKALNRRAVALKSLGKMEDSIRDFQALLKTKPTNEKEIRQEIDDMMRKLVEIQRTKKEQASKP